MSFLSSELEDLKLIKQVDCFIETCIQFKVLKELEDFQCIDQSEAESRDNYLQESFMQCYHNSHYVYELLKTNCNVCKWQLQDQLAKLSSEDLK